MVKSEFDSHIGGEPYIALMLLFNVKMGVYMARNDGLNYTQYAL